MKILYFDTETTGTNPSVHEITQLAAIVEIDGKVVEEVNFRCQPTNWDVIEPDAIETTGISIEQLKTFDTPDVMMTKLRNLLGKYIPKYTKLGDKFFPAGHNVQFDLDFLDAFIRKHGNADERQWGAVTWQNWRALDSRVFANFLDVAGKFKLPNLKLSTLCQYYKIDIDAHDALSDIRATRELVIKMMGEIK